MDNASLMEHHFVCSEEQDSPFSPACITAICVLSLVYLTAVIANLFSLLVLYRIHDMHDVTRLLLIALNLTDICVGFFGLLAIALDSERVHDVIIFIQMLGLLVLLMITIIRYVAVRHPLRLETIVTKRRASVALSCVTVILACALCVFQVIYPDDLLTLFIPEVILSSSVLIVILVLYVKMVTIAREQARRIAAAEINAAGAQFQLRRSNAKSLSTFVLMTGTVCVTWLAALLHEPFTEEVSLAFEIWGVTVLGDVLHSSGSWLNVAIYSWRNGSFRRSAKAMICTSYARE